MWILATASGAGAEAVRDARTTSFLCAAASCPVRQDRKVMVSAYVGMGLRKTHPWTTGVVMTVVDLDLCKEVLSLIVEEDGGESIQRLVCIGCLRDCGAT